MTRTKTTCPVCGWEISEDGHKVTIDKRIVLVCCDDCLKKVKENPGKYIKAK
jgi:ribosome-binding protein aMBF1 (putative translation factor)